MKKLYRILGKRGRITIPDEIRQRVGFGYNDVLSFSEDTDGRSVIVKREKVCDNCIESKEILRTNDEVTLLEFLNSLSPEQKKAALVHLSVLWAEHQTKSKGDKNG